ncbi:NitT/TauT family transport system permease protein [Rhodoblastus acidophilus]|uniref:ABC transporter permease n=1 Tax=Rhodoblastus acidophilus TaxID=1074 RepID=UPI001620EA25|nr:ABC transporter permease subunit [Rhodoblastus acidophilus]MCW2285187.1 NitT/TauT family transport system permease protein [Rhodoblastus acidophilus]MCW2334143.1 NitT/TauT family transport system permease protein [Rhodoblastus acidophilus]
MSRFVAFASLGRRALPNQWDLVSLALVIAVFVAVAKGSLGMTAPLTAPVTADLSLDYSNLPYYALRTTLRMSAAMAASLLFTFVYATIAAKSRRAEMVLIPLLDVLQSVPILGFLSFTVTFFLGLFPGSTLGAELAAIFAIFTSQAWNMAFSFYQSLRTVPRDLEEVAVGYHFSPWQKFWQLEAPFAMPALIWNMMMSMSGGWFFVVASEAISVGDTTIKLPGIGSYLALAIDAKRIDAVFAAVVAVIVVILAYDQLLFRPIVAFAAKFRVELSAGQVQEESWVRQIFLRTRFLRGLIAIPARILSSIALLRLDFAFPGFGGEPHRVTKRVLRSRLALSRAFDLVWFVLIGAMVAYCLDQVYAFVSQKLTAADLRETVVFTTYTMIRVFLLIVLASLFWVPVAIYIGLRPRLAEKIQPLAQFLAAFPANVVFPIAVVLVVQFSLNPDIWLSGLIIFGTQWYIVFNVIGGAMAFPNDLREAVVNYGIKGRIWWKDVILPGVFPYYVTGALTASGGSWNAAIVAEYVKWGDDKVAAHGIGAYIAQATEAGDYPKIVLGVAVMSIFVILFNRLLWRPLFAWGERRLRLN